MKQTAVLFISVLWLFPAFLEAQQKPTQKPTQKPKTAEVVTPGVAEQSAPESITKVVQTWLEAWNRLDGSEASTQRFVDLYSPDARHDTGPSPKPIGPEFFAAPNGIRKLAEDFGKTYTELAYRLETSTANERAFEMIYHTDGPWGGKAIAVPYTGAYTVRATKRRYFYPGVAVFHLNKAGKITYARFYSGRDQVAEVRP
jgi:SnoaL-like domain